MSATGLRSPGKQPGGFHGQGEGGSTSSVPWSVRQRRGAFSAAS